MKKRVNEEVVLWPFVVREGVEPMNNVAKRYLSNGLDGSIIHVVIQL